MQTGYDNFWMYQNNRHEPVLNIPKNDSYSQAILTDCYKQVQNGGHPNHLNSYISPQNNDASSHQNNQHRSLDPNCMWPSSVCLMPLKISNSRNVHAQEAFLAQSNNTCYLSSNSQPQQHSGYKYLKNSNVNVSQMYKNGNGTNNYSNCESSVLAKNNGNFKGQTQRIRVKDVFTLNNSTLHYQLLSNSCHQDYPKEQQECALNHHTVNYARSCTSDSRSQVINYGKNNIPQPPSTCYGQTTASEELPQYFQNSSSFYQQNTEYPLEIQNQFKRGRLVKQNLQLDSSETNSSLPLLRQLLYSRNSQEPKGQIEKNHSDPMYGNTSTKIIQQKHSVPINNLEMTNNSGCAGTLEINTGVIQKTSSLNNVTQIQHQENFTRINVASLPTSGSAAALNSNSGKNITSNGGGHSFDQISGQERTIVKISYPQNFQSTSVSPNDFNDTDVNSNITLPFLLESNDKFCSTLKKNSPVNNNNENRENRENEITNLPQTSQGNFSNTQAFSSVSSSPVLAQNCKEPPRKRLYPKEPFINLNKENIANFLNSSHTCENTSGNMSAMNGNENEIIPTVTMMPNYPYNALTLKQEKYENMESPSTIRRIPEEKVSFEIIKTEKDGVDENPEDSILQKYEAPPPQKPGVMMESVVADEGEDFTKVDVDEFVSASEKSQIASSNMEDCQGPDNINNNNALTEKKPEADVETTEVIDSMKNYKSKINRDKLDMLIQFLEADGPVETKLKSPCKKKLRSNKDCSKKGVDLSHNRRKLNKTHIVKNKNNSREMISYKIARVELTKCSSQPSQILKVNSSETEDRKCSNAEGKLRNVPSTEQEWEISSKPSPDRNSKIQDEENFLRTMRALQNLKTHFCVGCGLVSPIDSFWINVASAELRCFNCFSKVAVKGRQNAFKPKPDGSSYFGGKYIQKCQSKDGCENIEKFEWVTQNNVKAVDKSNDLHKVENADVKSTNAIKETIKHEVVQGEQQIEVENTTKRGIDSSHTFGKQRVSTEKGRDWEDKEKLAAKHPEKINKSKEASVTHKVKHPEDTPTVEVKEKKGADYSSQPRKRSDSKFLEEHTKREEKRVNSLSDKSVKKTKENHCIYKDNIEAQIIKKNPKCEQLEKSKTRSPSVESDPCQKPKPLEQTKPKESEESKIKSFFGLNDTEKHKRPETMQLRKRKNSEEDAGLSKIRILEDNTGKEKMRTKITNALKGDSADSKNKISDNERRKNLAERSRKNSSSKEEDHPKKETKQMLDLSDNSKMKDVLKGDPTYQKMKAHEQARQKSSEIPRRNSKDEQSLSSFDKQRGGKTSKQGANSPIFTLQELGKRGTKYGSYSVENNDRKKTDEKDKKHSSEKTLKSWSLEKDNREKVITSIENTGHPASKPLKEGGNNKDGSGTPRVKLDNKVTKIESHIEKKEVSKHAEGKRDEKKIDKNMKQKDMKNSEKKKYWELIERMDKCDQSQVENREADDKTVAVERKNRADVKRSLIQELIKKTRKSLNLI